jgi:hypothetical protein
LIGSQLSPACSPTFLNNAFLVQYLLSFAHPILSHISYQIYFPSSLKQIPIFIPVPLPRDPPPPRRRTHLRRFKSLNAHRRFKHHAMPANQKFSILRRSTTNCMASISSLGIHTRLQITSLITSLLLSNEMNLFKYCVGIRVMFLSSGRKKQP